MERVLIEKAALLERARQLDRYAWSDFASIVEEQPEIKLQAPQGDSIDLICEQIEKVVRVEDDAGDAYWAWLKDGQCVHFGMMNDVLRRFLFDNRYAKRIEVAGKQIEYKR